MEYTFKKLVASLAAKQLSENIFNIKTKGTLHLQMKSDYLNSTGSNRNETILPWGKKVTI